METMISKTGTTAPPRFTEADWTNKTILIADDVRINYLLLKAILGKTKANILWAKDGEEAINYCRNNQKIDVVLMDYNMPKMNGFEATKQIKQMRSDLPVISQTAGAMGSFEFDELISACDDYVLKPIDKKRLLRKIGKYINKQEI